LWVRLRETAPRTGLFRTRCGSSAPKVIPIGGRSGRAFNINKDCGSTEPRGVLRPQSAGTARRYRLYRARRRCRPASSSWTELGHLVDGDQLLAVIAGELAQGGAAGKNPASSTTVMSNFRPWSAISTGSGSRWHRVQVGDRYVLEQMRESKASISAASRPAISSCRTTTTTGDGFRRGPCKSWRWSRRSAKPVSAVLSSLRPRCRRSPRMSAISTGKPHEDAEGALRDCERRRASERPWPADRAAVRHRAGCVRVTGRGRRSIPRRGGLSTVSSTRSTRRPQETQTFRQPVVA